MNPQCTEKSPDPNAGTLDFETTGFFRRKLDALQNISVDTFMLVFLVSMALLGVGIILHGDRAKDTFKETCRAEGGNVNVIGGEQDFGRLFCDLP